MRRGKKAACLCVGLFGIMVTVCSFGDILRACFIKDSRCTLYH
jgi:hypothetical protein